MTDVKSHGKSAGNDPQLKGVVGMLAQKTRYELIWRTEGRGSEKGNQPRAQGSTRVRGAAPDSEQSGSRTNRNTHMTLPRAVLETRYCHLCNRQKGRTAFTDKIIKKGKRSEREKKKIGKLRTEDKKLFGVSQRSQWKREQCLWGTAAAGCFRP